MINLRPASLTFGKEKAPSVAALKGLECRRPENFSPRSGLPHKPPKTVATDCVTKWSHGIRWQGKRKKGAGHSRLRQQEAMPHAAPPDRPSPRPD